MGCVRRGKKQKQGTRTLTKEEATGVPSTSQRVHDNTNWAEVENRQLCKSFPSKLYEFYGSLLGEEMAEFVRKNFPPDDVKNLKEIPREFSNKYH